MKIDKVKTTELVWESRKGQNIGTAPVQPIMVKRGKNSHCAESNGKKESVKSYSNFSKLAKLLEFRTDGKPILCPHLSNYTNPWAQKLVAKKMKTCA